MYVYVDLVIINLVEDRENLIHISILCRQEERHVYVLYIHLHIRILVVWCDILYYITPTNTVIYKLVHLRALCHINIPLHTTMESIRTVCLFGNLRLFCVQHEIYYHIKRGVVIELYINNVKLIFMFNFFLLTVK